MIRNPSDNLSQDQRQTRTGIAYGLACYTWWGLAPLYFRAVAHVPAAEVLAHRIIWSGVLLTFLSRLLGRPGAVRSILRDRRTLALLLCSTVLIAGNWFAFIYAVASEQLLQASLGYFINPLVNVFLGFVVLRERLTRPQIISVLLAAMGVTFLTLRVGSLPMLALFLAISFAAYGLIRKLARVDALTGLCTETLLLLPPALLYLAYLGAAAGPVGSEGVGLVFGRLSRGTDALLAAGGVITAVPLLWFTHAARRLALTTLGFLQYVAPTLQFVIAVAFFGEAVNATQIAAFACIWSALAIFSWDAWKRFAALRDFPPRSS